MVSTFADGELRLGNGPVGVEERPVVFVGLALIYISYDGVSSLSGGDIFTSL